MKIKITKFEKNKVLGLIQLNSGETKIHTLLVIQFVSWLKTNHSTDFFIQVNWKGLRELKFEIWGLSDHNEKSYEC